MSSCNRLCQTSCNYCRNSAMVVAGSGERVSSRFIMSPTCSTGERSGDLVGQCSCCTPRRTCCIVAAVRGCALSCWKAHYVLLKSTSSSCWNDSFMGFNNLCTVARTVYFTLQKHQMLLRVVIDDPHTMKSEMRSVCSGWMHSRRWCSPGLHLTCVHPDRTYSHHWR